MRLKKLSLLIVFMFLSIVFTGCNLSVNINSNNDVSVNISEVVNPTEESLIESEVDEPDVKNASDTVKSSAEPVFTNKVDGKEDVEYFLFFVYKFLFRMILVLLMLVLFVRIFLDG